jgi:hypothetical protein
LRTPSALCHDPVSTTATTKSVILNVSEIRESIEEEEEFCRWRRVRWMKLTEKLLSDIHRAEVSRI